MIVVTCGGCMTQAFVGCGCPPGYTEQMGGHVGDCALSNLGATVVCPPDSDCCKENHDHDEAANNCHGEHAGEPCPEPASCAVWQSQQARVGPDDPTPDHLKHLDADSCPGGHCHKDVDGCSVCRPLTITFASDAGTLRMAN